jgi:hypothetical protein
LSRHKQWLSDVKFRGYDNRASKILSIYSSDFKKLNKVIVKNKYPFTRIDDLFDHLKDVKIFLKNDLRSGYHQVRIKEEGISKNSFRMRYGHYDSIVVPFGLSNATIFFMCQMNGISENA